MKVIVDANPEAIVQFVLRQCRLTRGVDIPLEGLRVVAQLSTEFQGSDAEADGLLLLEAADGRQIMVHIEFQSKRDKIMPDRLLDYCLRARRKYGPLPIISCVIYLRDDGQVEEPPWLWPVSKDYTNLAFDYVCIKLWETPREEVLALQQPVLLPLALLAKGEVNRIIVRDMLKELMVNKLYDLLPIGQTIAGWLLAGTSLEWLKKEYFKMFDLFKDSPVYEWMTESAREEAQHQVEEANQRTLEANQRTLEANQRTIEKFRQTVLAIVAQRFPTLVRSAQKQVQLSQDTDRLQKLLIDLSLAQNVADAEHYLLHFDEDGEG
jgi:hypothetical protein